jgi:hypothetical protein
MRRRIVDKYQLRKQRDNCCTECGAPAVDASRCLKHLVLARERQRAKHGLKARYLNTLSYRLELQAAAAAKKKKNGASSRSSK